MRRSTRLAEKLAKAENESQREPKAKKKRSNDKTPKIANMDNGTMVEAFKYLNYCQLAKNSLVSKRFRNVIETHRHKLALLYVDVIRMGRFSGIDPAFIKLFNKVISPKEYNEWVVRNNYSKEISAICEAAGNRRAYELTAYRDYKDPNQESTQVFIARLKELNHETWPLFQHFVRLITDSFIRIRYLELIPQADVLKLLAATIERSNRGRLQCGKLDFDFNGNNVFESDFQESFNYIKDHMRCANFEIAGYRSSPDHDEQLLDFFTSGSHCTPVVFVTTDRISKAVIVDFVQKFMDLKSCDDVQLVESIRGRVSTPTEEALISNYYNFFTKEEEYRYGCTAFVFEIVNADIGKKMRLSILGSYEVTLEILNL